MTPDPATVFELIERGAAMQPAAVYAVAAEDVAQSMTYGALREASVHVGEALAATGLHRGDTVSLVMPNGLQTIRLLLGFMHAGCCVNPVNLLAQPEQLRYVLGHSDCRLVIAAPEWAERVRAALAGVGREVRLVILAADGDFAALR
jgi:acyl-CoA synthetase (AMP-forming)/AMP-acid ligase II